MKKIKKWINGLCIVEILYSLLIIFSIFMCVIVDTNYYPVIVGLFLPILLNMFNTAFNKSLEWSKADFDIILKNKISKKVVFWKEQNDEIRNKTYLEITNTGLLEWNSCYIVIELYDNRKLYYYNNDKIFPNKKSYIEIACNLVDIRTIEITNKLPFQVVSKRFFGEKVNCKNGYIFSSFESLIEEKAAVYKKYDKCNFVRLKRGCNVEHGM